MPVIRMPDGAQISFPDDMPKEQIRSLIHKKFPDQVPQTQNSGEYSQVETDRGRFIVNPQGQWVPVQVDGKANKTLNYALDKTDGDLQQSVDMARRLDSAKPAQQPYGFADALSDGATFGLSNRAAALGAATGQALRGNGFDYGRAYERRIYDRDQYAKESPGANIAGNIVGGLATGGLAAKNGLTLMKEGAGFWGNIGRTAAEGGAYGLLYGAGQSDADNVSDTVKDAISGGESGAIAGAVLGPAAHLVSKGAGSAYNWGKNKLTSNIGKPENQAASRLSHAIDQAGKGSDDISKALDGLGPEGALIDILGPHGHALGRSAANVSPAARETFENALAQRMAGQPDRVTDALLKAGGLTEAKTVQELQKAARDEGRPAIDAAYDEARSKGYDIDTTAFDDLWLSSIAQKAHAEGGQLAAERLIAEMARKGPIEGDIIPSKLAVLDETKKSLDARGKPDLGKPQTNQQAIAAKLAETLRGRIDDALPEYGGARKLAQNLKKREAAIALGAEGAKSRIPADFARRAGAISDDHGGDLAQGYASGMIDKYNNRRTTPGAVDAVFSAPRQQEAMQAALGPKAAGVKRQLDAERAFSRTDRALTGNSTTARQLMESGLVPGGAGAGLGYMVGGDPSSAGLGVFAGLLARKAGGAAMQKMRTNNENKVAPILADLMMSRNVPEKVGKQLKKQSATPELQNLITRALIMQGGGAGYGPTVP